VVPPVVVPSVVRPDDEGNLLGGPDRQLSIDALVLVGLGPTVRLLAIMTA
jgi:hypothetical protein